MDSSCTMLLQRSTLSNSSSPVWCLHQQIVPELPSTPSFHTRLRREVASMAP